MTLQSLLKSLIADNAASQGTQEYDSDLDELLSLDGNPTGEVEDDNIR